MAHPFRLRPVAALIYLTFSGPLLAAQPPVAETGSPSPAETGVDAASAASVCRDDIKSFDSQMAKDGYWRSGEGYGFGYPMGAAGFGMYGSGLRESPAFAGLGYRNARPGYEVRVLVHAANILAPPAYPSVPMSCLAQRFVARVISRSAASTISC